MKDLKLTADNLDYITQELGKLDLTKAKRIKVTEWKEKRGLSANGQIHLWFGQIAKHYGDRSALEVKCFCKDSIGLPILSNSESHGDKLEFFLSQLNYYKHNHENKMKLIQFIPVTSEMSTSEIKEFMEQMVYYWNDLDVPIKFKDK
ncbi:MAG: hypothetical protein V3R25_06120 [Nitrosomonadaceae bacterium]